jgi:hypothetical protein
MIKYSEPLRSALIEAAQEKWPISEQHAIETVELAEYKWYPDGWNQVLTMAKRRLIQERIDNEPTIEPAANLPRIWQRINQNIAAGVGSDRRLSRKRYF